MTRVARACALLALSAVLGAELRAEDRPPASARAAANEDVFPERPSLAQRLDEIRRRVQRARTYPPIARKRGIEGETRVAFEIDAGGRPRGLETVASSGFGALDRAALQAVERAGVLPWVYGRVTVPVRFRLREPD